MEWASLFITPKASIFPTEDIQEAVDEAQNALLEAQQTLQFQSHSPYLTQNKLRNLLEYFVAFQRIIDLSHEISQLEVKGDAAACERMMRDMRAAKQEPNVTTCSTLMNARTKVRSGRDVLGTFIEMQKCCPSYVVVVFFLTGSYLAYVVIIGWEL